MGAVTFCAKLAKCTGRHYSLPSEAQLVPGQRLLKRPGKGRGPFASGSMNPLLRLLGAAASHGLLTGQLVYSVAFVGACELPNWLLASAM